MALGPSAAGQEAGQREEREGQQSFHHDRDRDKFGRASTKSAEIVGLPEAGSIKIRRGDATEGLPLEMQVLK